MLKSIARLSPDLVDFINSLDHPLNRPQSQHIARVADGLITTEGRKTLSDLYRATPLDPFLFFCGRHPFIFR